MGNFRFYLQRSFGDNLLIRTMHVVGLYYLVFSFFCLVSNLVNGTTVAVGLNIAWLVLLSGSKGVEEDGFNNIYGYLIRISRASLYSWLPSNRL